MAINLRSKGLLPADAAWIKMKAEGSSERGTLSTWRPAICFKAQAGEGIAGV